LAQQGVTATIESDHLLADTGKIYPLRSLAFRCRETDEAEWPSLLEHCIASLVTADRELAATPPPTAAADEALLPRLRLRLGPGELARRGGVGVREIVPGLSITPVLDYPEYVDLLDAGAYERLGGSLVEEAGRAGLRQEPIDYHETTAGRSGEELHVIGGTSIFTASKILVPGDLARLAGAPHTPPLGMLFCAPQRHLLAFHLIRDKTCFAAAMSLMNFGELQFKEELEWPISPDVYWMRAGMLSPALRRDGRNRSGRALVTGKF
jgi:hypothetical protein